MKRFLVMIALVSGCEVVSGAGDFEVSPIVGSWESTITVEGKKIDAKFFGDETGDVKFPALVNLTQLVLLHADATWKELDDDKFRVVLNCDDAVHCPLTLPKEQRTFLVTCTARSSGESLVCKGENDGDQAFELERSN